MLSRLSTKSNSLFKPAQLRFASTFDSVGSEYKLDDVKMPSMSKTDDELMVEQPWTSTPFKIGS